MKLLSVLAFSTLTILSFGQIQVTNTLTPQELVEQVLVGTGVTPTNITVNGSAADASTIQVNATYFNQNGTTFPIPEGVLLSSGNGQVAAGPNDSGSDDDSFGTTTISDVDMDAIELSGVGITNGIVLEFDFVATGNLLEFDYIFGSEEYNEFAPPNSSGFNDVFGFFLSGPGIAGPYSNAAVNLAEIPGSGDPVSINNVNAITNTAYFINNEGGAYYGNAIQYDGTTTTLTATSELICGETYHIKFGIANVADQAWDSGVFLQGGSFSVQPVGFEFNTFTVDNIILEDCNQLGTLMFTREGCNVDLGETLTAYLSFTGEATNGVDYEELGDSVFFDVGEDTIFWQVVPYQDGLDEGIESIDISISTIDINGDTITSTGTFYISDNPEMSISSTDHSFLCYGDSLEIGATITGGLAPLTYSWNPTNQTDSSIYVPIDVDDTTDYIITVTDFCGTEVMDTITVEVSQALQIDSLLSWPATCEPVGVVQAFVTDDPTNGQEPLYEWHGPNDPISVQSWDATVWLDRPGGWYYFYVEDGACSDFDSVFVDTENVPSAQMSANPTSGCAPLVVSLTNDSQNANSFYWDFGNGNTLNTNDLNGQTQTYVNSGIVMLVASNGNLACNDTTYMGIEIVPCGCTDPSALNYDPFAVIDDGSCTYPPPPVPTVTAPNVFTPNDDQVNSVFVLTTENAEIIDLTILNRWGNVIYEGRGGQDNPPSWDGTVNGKDATAGVYFYKYKVQGFDDLVEPLEGHGFFNLIR